MSRVRDLAWLAGIIEGEGCLTQNGSLNRVFVSMTDEDVVRRCHEITGIGHVRRKGLTTSGKTLWSWYVSKSQDVAALLMTIWPFLGERRRARAEQLLVDWKSHKLKMGNPAVDRCECARCEERYGV